MESSQFTDNQPQFESLEPLDVRGSTCDTFRVKLYGKLHFLKRLKPEYANDILYQEAFRKEFETGYRLEHPNLVRYISLTDDAIFMEYVDGETLTQRLTNHPDFFKNKNNSNKFLLQLLDVVGYLHSHQVLHLDLKPDNILLTRINDDVKLIDLGCCYTDTFADTQGRTNRFAAPEQLTGGNPDVRTDLYAIGKILELLPNHHIYNKVIAHFTAPEKADRYQSVDEVLQDVNHKRSYLLYSLILTIVIVALLIAIALFTQPASQPASVPNDMKIQNDTIELSRDSLQTLPSKAINAPIPQTRDDVTQMKKDLEKMINEVYRSTISSFCDSVFPSPSVGNSWAIASTTFHQQVSQIGDHLVKTYPTISETIIREEAESRFQSLASYVFNKMREHSAMPLNIKDNGSKP